MLARKMVSSSGTQRPPESWSQYGLASVVHCLLVDGSGRGSCLERPVKCCRNRWSILLSNRVPMESWSQCGLASMAHLVLAGGSGWDSYDGTSPITWQGRWSVLLSHKGPRNPDVGMAWPPWCTPAGGWLRTGSHLERPDACFHNRWSILLSNRVTMESRSQCGPASMVHLVLAGGSGWDSYDGTSPITWQGRWSVLLSHKGPRNPDVGMAWPPWCTPAGGWLRTGQLSGESCHVLLQQIVDSSKQQCPRGVVESVCPDIYGAPCAGGWLRMGAVILERLKCPGKGDGPFF
nr:uncharacterized protein LOC104650394 isoform X3 [Saimiri boliviensis boliviensis]